MTRARSRKRTAVAVAASILFHLTLIAPLAVLIPHLPPSKLGHNEPIELQLRQQRLPTEQATASRASGSAGPPLAPADRSPIANRLRKADGHPNPAPAAATVAQGGAGPDPNPVAGSAAPASGETAARVRQALRRLGGCANSGLLSQDELEACRQDRKQQYAIGEAMRMDTLSANKRADYDHAREVCDRVYTYSGLDSDRDHSAKAPQVYGNPC